MKINNNIQYIKIIFKHGNLYWFLLTLEIDNLIMVYLKNRDRYIYC